MSTNEHMPHIHYAGCYGYGLPYDRFWFQKVCTHVIEFKMYFIHSLVNVSTVRLHLLDGSREFVEQFLICIQGEQIIFSEKETKAVALGPAQAMTRRCCHGGNGVLHIHHGVQLT